MCWLCCSLEKKQTALSTTLTCDTNKKLSCRGDTARRDIMPPASLDIGMILKHRQQCRLMKNKRLLLMICSSLNRRLHRFPDITDCLAYVSIAFVTYASISVKWLSMNYWMLIKKSFLFQNSASISNNFGTCQIAMLDTIKPDLPHRYISDFKHFKLYCIKITLRIVKCTAWAARYVQYWL